MWCYSVSSRLSHSTTLYNNFLLVLILLSPLCGGAGWQRKKMIYLLLYWDEPCTCKGSVSNVQYCTCHFHLLTLRKSYKPVFSNNEASISIIDRLDNQKWWGAPWILKNELSLSSKSYCIIEALKVHQSHMKVRMHSHDGWWRIVYGMSGYQYSTNTTVFHFYPLLTDQYNWCHPNSCALSWIRDMFYQSQEN